MSPAAAGTPVAGNSGATRNRHLVRNSGACARGRRQQEKLRYRTGSVEGEAAKFVRVGDQVDCHDSAMSKREPDNGERSASWSHDQSGGAVDESHSRCGANLEPRARSCSTERDTRQRPDRLRHRRPVRPAIHRPPLHTRPTQPHRGNRVANRRWGKGRSRELGVNLSSATTWDSMPRRPVAGSRSLHAAEGHGEPNPRMRVARL